MTDILRQDEIDQLLNAIATPLADTPEPVRIKIYDFKRPDKFSAEQLEPAARKKLMNEFPKEFSVENFDELEAAIASG